MEIKEKVALAPFTTFKIGGHARYFCVLKDMDDAAVASDFSQNKNIPIFVLGGGSNIIVSDEDLECLVIKNEILCKEILEEDENQVLISVGAGENWDEFVSFTVDKGFSGLEALSAIPGTVGGAPIQNIGAYGAEVSQYIDSVDTYDFLDKSFKTFSKDECDFKYRDSLFKKEKNRFIILKVVFRLSKGVLVKIPDYPGVQETVASSSPTAKDIREAVIKIRSKKLPDPKIIPNVGSFFKNPIISRNIFKKLEEKFLDIKSFPVSSEEVKLSAGWLIERAVGKGKKIGNVATYDNNALVLVNTAKAAFEDVLVATNEIRSKVKEAFGVELETEPIFVNSQLFL